MLSYLLSLTILNYNLLFKRRLKVVQAEVKAREAYPTLINIKAYSIIQKIYIITKFFNFSPLSLLSVRVRVRVFSYLPLPKGRWQG